jgi:hypothetical protein
MSILSETGQAESITRGWRALELFTDRFEATRTFAEYLNEDPPRKQILFFYGDGGNGKSLLLSHLRQHCCKRLSPENGQYVKTFQDEEFAMQIQEAEGAEPIPSALLDFAWQPRGDDRPQEAFRALLMLRRALSGPGFRFPLFDFACVWYLYKTDQLSKERLRSLFPAQEADFLSELVDVATDAPWVGLGKAVLGIFDKHLGKRFTV